MGRFPRGSLYVLSVYHHVPWGIVSGQAPKHSLPVFHFHSLSSPWRHAPAGRLLGPVPVASRIRLAIQNRVLF